MRVGTVGAGGCGWVRVGADGCGWVRVDAGVYGCARVRARLVLKCGLALANANA